MGRYIILDTGAILRLGRHDFMDDVLLTVPSVIREVKDKTALEKMFYLQDRIQIMEPSEQDCGFVKKFSKETGDFGFLSETDFQVIALTLAYHKKYDEISKLNNRPKQITLVTKAEEAGRFEEGMDEDLEKVNMEADERKEESTEDEEDWETAKGQNNRREEVQSEEKEEDEEDGRISKSLEDDVFSGGWITKANITSVMGGLSSGSQSHFVVACMTTDYSMQNVLLQMGLNLVEIHGLSVKTIKRWGLLCCGCYTFERDTSRKFCGKCGNATLDRVPIKVSSDGTIELDCYRKKVNLRGTIYSIPKPKRGVRNQEIILAEDQLMMGGRQRLLSHQRKKWEKACKERDPFSNSGADLESNWGKQFGSFKYPEIKIGMGRGNPNSNSWQKKHNNKKR
ncbi:ART-4 PIN+Zn ribbon involved in RNA metabolism [Cryptosporidium sp. chipmunk genotype I]|uniref:ART-4 PIN+Zn ribbon involved in RNA metabolism n=1 Tax=Cryptosporidium sp. chipmunk genotype I TaxID=1280935 RepID=UPI00351A077D|nr:ART-4 PIN+Zn ribbon involved in RNA metabolism [Cryptosporidium sp. chipmunk genotype I]